MRVILLYKKPIHTLVGSERKKIECSIEDNVEQIDIGESHIVITNKYGETTISRKQYMSNIIVQEKGSIYQVHNDPKYEEEALLKLFGEKKEL